MSVLIVRESFFGNGTAMIDAVAEGLAETMGADSVQVVEAAVADSVIPDDVSVLVVSSPTHELSMPTLKTREIAMNAGGAGHVERGVREWISDIVPRGDVQVFAIDTCTRAGSVVGSASKAIVKAMKRLKFADVTRGPSFYVGDTSGPLLDDQLEKARQWGRELAGEIAVLA